MVQENLCKLWVKDSLAIAMVIMLQMVEVHIESGILYNLLLPLQYCKHGKIRWTKHSWFHPYYVSVSQEYFCSTLASSVYYLTIAKYIQENFCSTLKSHKNCESLAQRIFLHLRYLDLRIAGHCANILASCLMCVALRCASCNSCNTSNFPAMRLTTLFPQRMQPS